MGDEQQSHRAEQPKYLPLLFECGMCHKTFVLKDNEGYTHWTDDGRADYFVCRSCGDAAVADGTATIIAKPSA